MSRKSNDFYFNNFIECADYSCKAAEMIYNTLSQFNAYTLKDQLAQMHEIEHGADVKKHEMMSALVKEFITPIERDDIIELSATIDDVTDSIEDILIHIYISDVKTMRKDCMDFANLVVDCCKAVKEMLVEFKDFKKSKTLVDMIIRINTLEENGDELYMSSMKNLHESSQDPLEIIAWREIYDYFEKVFDACEDVSDIVQSIAIENV